MLTEIMKKERGPRMLPCDTPEVISPHNAVFRSFNEVLCFLYIHMDYIYLQFVSQDIPSFADKLEQLLQTRDVAKI